MLTGGGAPGFKRVACLDQPPLLLVSFLLDEPAMVPVVVEGLAHRLDRESEVTRRRLRVAEQAGSAHAVDQLAHGHVAPLQPPLPPPRVRPRLEEAVRGAPARTSRLAGHRPITRHLR